MSERASEREPERQRDRESAQFQRYEDPRPSLGIGRTRALGFRV